MKFHEPITMCYFWGDDLRVRVFKNRGTWSMIEFADPENRFMMVYAVVSR